MGCRRLQDQPRVRKNTQGLPTSFPHWLGANHAPNEAGISSSWLALLDTHSKRRISTGRSRTAARAGKIVAPIEIPMAITVIQSPSNRLG